MNYGGHGEKSDRVSSGDRCPVSGVRCPVPELTSSIQHPTSKINSVRSVFSVVLFTLLFFLCFLLPAFSQSLENIVGKPIAEVKLVYEGAAAALPTNDLRGFLRVREGSNYSVVEARRSLLALFDSGRVANVRIEAKLNPEGNVIVTFLVTPQQRIGEINFTGLVTEISLEEMRAKLPDLDRGLKFSEVNLSRGADFIVELLRDRGYYQAAVEPKITLDKNGTVVDIDYNITAGTAAKITAINFTGTNKLPEATLRLALKSKIGANFVRATLNADLQQLLQMHLSKNYFAASVGPADINYDTNKNSVVLNLPIISGPICEVKSEGIEISEKQFRKLLPLMREGGIDDASLDDSARRIRDHLQEEGYFFAEVEPPPMPDLTADRAVISFAVTPNQRYRVTEIRIEGTVHLNYLEIASSLQTQTAAFFSIPLFSPSYIRGITSEQSLKRDSDVILTQLRDQGYRRARMRAVNRAVSEDNDQLKIIFKVDEGPLSHVGDVAFKGNALFTTDFLREKIALKPGDNYSISRIKIEANKVLQHYYDEGYASASVLARSAEMNDNKVRVIYEISEGPKVYIRNVQITQEGARKRTIGGRIGNYLHFKEGDLLKNDDLLRSEQELYGAGAFRSVQIRTEQLGEEGATGEVQRNVYVDVLEGKSRSFVYGGGYQSDEGPRGIFEISDPNLFGRLTTGSIRLRASPRNLLGQLSYTDPRPFNFSTPLLASLLVQEQKRVAFDSTRWTALLQVEKQINPKSILLFRYNFDDVTVRESSLQPRNEKERLLAEQQRLNIDRRDRPIRLSRLSTSYAFDGRDNPFDSTTGRYHTADVTLAMRAFGGNGQFARVFTENQFYYRVPKLKTPTIFAADFRFGVSANLGQPIDKILPSTSVRVPIDLKLIPLTERFFSGGSSTLRGYNFELAGPRQCTVAAVVDGTPTPEKLIGLDCSLVPANVISKTTDQVIGGNALMIFNAEIRQPLYRQISLVGFYDGGNIFRTFGEMKPGNFSHSVGVGLRIKTPLGPLRFDMGYLASDPFAGTTLTPQQNPSYRAPRVRFHLSFGQAF